MKKARILAALFAVSVLAGCASRDVPVDLPIVRLDPPIHGGRERQVVVVVPFRDERAIRNRCGMRALTAGAGGYHLSLRRSMQTILAEMVTAIVELADEYPQLGRIDGETAKG
jgi:hypothetical protein